MDDAPFAEKIQGRAGRVALATMALRSSKEQSRSWFHLLVYTLENLYGQFDGNYMFFKRWFHPPKKHKSVTRS